MSINTVSSQPPHFAKPQSSGSAKEAYETPAKEASEGSSSPKASPPPGTAQVFDILA